MHVSVITHLSVLFNIVCELSLFFVKLQIISTLICMEEVHCPFEEHSREGERMWYEACMFALCIYRTKYFPPW